MYEEQLNVIRDQNTILLRESRCPCYLRTQICFLKKFSFSSAVPICHLLACIDFFFSLKEKKAAYDWSTVRWGLMNGKYFEFL